ncbi:MAG: ATP-binding protein [Bacteroidales bacterium]|nr:ATP-binding protein [Bacteroidales bacterium]
MLFRKFGVEIERFLKSGTDQILVVEGARQVGKSFLIREVCSRLYENFIELNFVTDDEGKQMFKRVRTTEDFYLALSVVAGDKLGGYDDTIVFLDEIQQYPHYLTMLKFFRQERRFRFIASGSMLGIVLNETTSVPVGSIVIKRMSQLDFEEFAIANGVGSDALEQLHQKYRNKESLSEEMHQHFIGLFRRYMLVGGMPDAVNAYVLTHNIQKVREVQDAISDMYSADASKYETDRGKHLLVRRIYEMVPSQMENKKKRVVVKEIRGNESDRFSRYANEFEYLISSGVTLAVRAVSNPRYPLCESMRKNLLKLYLNDVGILTAKLYRLNIQAVLDDIRSINLGSVYENAVAQELQSHGYKLFYYDNRQRGEVDFLVDDTDSQSLLPIEVKSGKDYMVHSALNNMLSNPEYNVKSALVLSNNRVVKTVGQTTYMPIYYVMFILPHTPEPEKMLF